LGYRGLADLIVADHLGPEHIARLFALSASKTRAQDLAVILSAGSIASFKSNPHSWSGEIERRLSQEAIARQGNGLDFNQLSGRAAALVKKRWPEIERLSYAPRPQCMVGSAFLGKDGRWQRQSRPAARAKPQ
jgi:hypothetical protein